MRRPVVRESARRAELQIAGQTALVCFQCVRRARRAKELSSGANAASNCRAPSGSHWFSSARILAF